MTIPAKAKQLLSFIGSIEAPQGYDTIYGNNQKKLKKPITQMTIDEVIANGRNWTKRYGSSASGFYQFMRDTLKGLKAEGKCRGDELFDADCQDRLGYALLVRRGFNQFLHGSISKVEFGKRLAQEWASFPVLRRVKGAHRMVERGQSYYAGDGVNKALVSPIRVEAVLAALKGSEAPQPRPKPEAPPAPAPDAGSDPAIETDDLDIEIPAGDGPPEEKLRWSKRLWIWLTTGFGGAIGMLNESGLLFLDRYVLLAILGVIVVAAIFSIATMPAVRKTLGISFK
jgi:muramidase (phage lysozyme)